MTMILGNVRFVLVTLILKVESIMGVDHGTRGRPDKSDIPARFVSIRGYSTQGVH